MFSATPRRLANLYGLLSLINMLFWSFFTSIALAWDVTGHRISAEVAYQNLSTCARAEFDQQLALMRQQYPYVRTIGDFAAMPDLLKARGIHTYDHWHYYNHLWRRGAQAKAKGCLEKKNALWALQQADKNLANKKLSKSERAFFSSFAWHLIGDLHQPLHTLSLVDKRFPMGDKGGLLYRIGHHSDNNLHQLWDRGLDHFGLPHADYPLRNQQVKNLAQKWQSKHPKKRFKSELKERNPSMWIKNSQNLAKTVVYQIGYQQKPSKAYIAQGSELAQSQITLAGYRMAQHYETISHCQSHNSEGI